MSNLLRCKNKDPDSGNKNNNRVLEGKLVLPVISKSPSGSLQSSQNSDQSNRSFYLPSLQNKNKKSRDGPTDRSTRLSPNVPTKSSRTPTPNFWGDSSVISATNKSKTLDGDSGQAQRTATVYSSKQNLTSLRPAKRQKLREKTTGMTLDTKQKLELRSAFGLFDPRGGGLIDSRAALIGMRALGEEPTDYEFTRWCRSVQDTPSSTMDFKEFHALLEYRMTTHPTLDEIRKGFQLFSDPQAGGVTVEKLMEIAKELDISLSKEEIKYMITCADIHGNSVIGFREFRKIFENPSFFEKSS